MENHVFGNLCGERGVALTVWNEPTEHMGRHQENDMARHHDSSGQMQIAVFGKLPQEQRHYLEMSAESVHANIVAVGSYEAFRETLLGPTNGPAILIVLLKDNVEPAIKMVASTRNAGSAISILVLASANDAAYVPLMKELGISRVVHYPLRGAECADALRAVLAASGPPAPSEAPLLTDDELGVNIERLADDLNKRMRCSAGQNQVFLHSYVGGAGGETQPRVTLKCPLRVTLRLSPYVYYQHIRDMCCGEVDTCPVLRAYTAMHGQSIRTYVRADTLKERIMPDQAESPRPASGSPPHAASRSVEHARPRHGLPDNDEFLKAVVRLGASDLLLKTGFKPRVRVGGRLREVDVEPLPSAEFEERLFKFLSPKQQQQLLDDGSVDFAYDVPGSDRFRINIFRQESGLSVAARRITRDIPSFEALNLPPIIQKITEYRQGLVLLAGVTGSGKSTTIAAMIEHINQTRADHIVTIEDPIEYLFTSKRCLINQREIGINVKDFPTALRALVRENPDIVLIGEMRDSETFRAALQASETGHLVFGTVHASTCPQTIGRVLDLFPEEERRAVRQSFVFNLRAIVAQKLLPTIREGLSRVPATEVLLNIPIVQKLIAEERDADIADTIRAGEEGMHSFTDRLQWLIERDFIDLDTAYAATPNPEELKMRLQGIRLGTGHVLG